MSISRKYRPRIDIRRRYGYNTYRVRPKRSATNKVLFPKRELPLWLQQGGYFFLIVIVMDWMSRLSAASNIIISSIILHTSFRMVCWGPAAAGQFLPVPRGGTSSVVEDYTSLSHSFRAFEAYTAERCFTYRKVPPIRWHGKGERV